MAKGKGPGPSLDQETAKRLLDKLATDDDFRDQFSSDPHSALASIGYEAPAVGAKAGGCMQMQAGQSLPSAEEINNDRQKFERALTGVFGFASPLA